MSAILLIAVALLLALGLFLGILALLGGRSRQSEMLEEVTGQRAPAAEGGTTTGRPWLQPLAAVGAQWGGGDPELTRRLQAAGFRQPQHVQVFAGLRLLLPLLLGGLAALWHPGSSTFFCIVLSLSAGFLGPDIWLRRRLKRRHRSIDVALPDMLDLLSICLQAGLGLDQAMLRVGQELSLSHPALSEELMQVNREQRAGQPRLTAWRGVAERVPLDAVRSFVNMLSQTERFGTPISRSLSVFSDGLRTKRRQLAEEAAAKTTIKMVLPLVVFIFPTVFIVTVAPAVLRIAENFTHLI